MSEVTLSMKYFPIFNDDKRVIFLVTKVTLCSVNVCFHKLFPDMCRAQLLKFMPTLLNAFRRGRFAQLGIRNLQLGIELK